MPPILRRRSLPVKHFAADFCRCLGGRTTGAYRAQRQVPRSADDRYLSILAIGSYLCRR